MTDYLTSIPGTPDPASAVPGMAFFAGTGPQGKTCKACKHFGYERTSAKDKLYRWLGCAMFKRLTGSHGPRISEYNRACKYYEAIDERKKP